MSCYCGGRQHLT